MEHGSDSDESRLVPRAVRHAPWPISAPLRLFHLLRNPLRLDPIEAYHETMVVRPRTGSQGTDAWFSDPALTDELLGRQAHCLAKSEFEKRVLGRLIGAGVLTADGDLWRWQRRTVAPLFRPAAMRQYVPVMAETANEVVRSWRAEGDRVRAMDSDMTDATSAIIMRTMHAGSRQEENRLIKSASRRFIAGTAWEGAYRLMNVPRWLPNPGSRHISAAVGALRGAMEVLIARKQRELTASVPSTGDLISQLIAARDPETDAAMSQEQLIDNLLTIVEAGYESTASALTWTMYLLARSPNWQARLREEITDVTGSGPIEAAHLPRLELTQSVFKESLRLYPPGSTLGRVFVAPVTVAGHRFQPGDVAMFPAFCIHRHRGLWRDPDLFDPSRFTGSEEAGHRRGQYIPFGFGARSCIGQAFAVTEATIVIATLIRSARLHWTGGREPEPVSRVTLSPRGGLRLRVEWLQ